MSKLYSDDEGYQVKLNRGTLRGRKKLAEKSPKKVTSPRKEVSNYSLIRDKMSELISDQEPVLEPPVNPVIDLAALTHDEFVDQASQVIDEYNPEGQHTQHRKCGA